MDFNVVLEESKPVRDRETVIAALEGALDVHCMSMTRLEHIWTLIRELEEGSWRAGADEGMEWERAYGKGAETE